jgi:hypothetical protein
MPTLKKLFVARFFEKGSKRPFHSDKVVADSFRDAEDIAFMWGMDKWGQRLLKVEIEKSKGGEVIAND